VRFPVAAFAGKTVFKKLRPARGFFIITPFIPVIASGQRERGNPVLAMDCRVGFASSQ